MVGPKDESVNMRTIRLLGGMSEVLGRKALHNQEVKRLVT